MRSKTVNFELPVNGAMYAVKATPYTIATKETRFRVSVNDSPVYIFGWDTSLDRFSILEDKMAEIGGKIEMAISGKLENIAQQKRAA